MTNNPKRMRRALHITSLENSYRIEGERLLPGRELKTERLLTEHGAIKRARHHMVARARECWNLVGHPLRAHVWKVGPQRLP